MGRLIERGVVREKKNSLKWWQKSLSKVWLLSLERTRIER